MPYVTDTQTTYGLLALLVCAHILLNYAAVRGVVLRSLNRQRAGLLWRTYRLGGLPYAVPRRLAALERIFASPSVLLHSNSRNRKVAGHCYVGSPLSAILPAAHGHSSAPQARWATESTPETLLDLFDLFSSANYVVWFGATPSPSPELHVVLKDGHGVQDHLKAWVLATELASLAEVANGHADRSLEELMDALQQAMLAVDELFPQFLQGMREVGWDLDAAAGGFVTGLPTTVNIEYGEDRKSR